MTLLRITDERELLQKLRDGDQTAFSQVFCNYYQGMCSFAERYVSVDNVEDIVDDVFLKLLKTEINFKDLIHLKAYLYRAVKHSCLDFLKQHIRENERHTVYSEIYNEPQSSYLAHIMQTEATRILYSALETLPNQTSRVLRLTYLDGLSNQEAANELGVSINTIKTQKQRGLNKLRQILPKEQFGILLIYLFY